MRLTANHILHLNNLLTAINFHNYFFFTEYAPVNSNEVYLYRNKNWQNIDDIVTAITKFTNVPR